MIKRNHLLYIVVTIVITLLFNVLLIKVNISRFESTKVNMTTRRTSSITKRNIEYGTPLKVGRTPLVMFRSSLDDVVLERFWQYAMFSCSENELNSFKGLENRVKPPIYIYEGYFHSLPTKETVFSRNPNPTIAIDFNKPAADIFLRAFYETFRRINADIFLKLKEDLIESAVSRVPNNPESDICYGFTKWIDKGYIAGDLSIQIHYGQNNDAKFKSAWHTDALNSLLHLAITIRGKRILHSFRSNTTNGLPVEILEAQMPGGIYLSSSTLMKHAPQFFDTNYETRVIAIHARILYTTEEMKSFSRNITDEGWNHLTTIIANTLASNDIKIPNIKEIEKVESELV